VVTVLSPHLDDAVLDCWSVLTSAAEVRVVNVFAGEPGAEAGLGWWDDATGAEDSAERMRLRREEDAEALAQAGCAPVNLDFLEDQYRGGRPVPGDDLFEAVLPHLEGDLAYVPAGIGLHGDHVAVRSLLAPLRERGTAVGLYADIPYCVRHGWPGWVTGDPPGRADEHWVSCLGGTADGLRPRVVRLDAAAQERKRRALVTYRSQFAALRVGSSRHVADPDVLLFEVLWEPADGPAIDSASRA